MEGYNKIRKAVEIHTDISDEKRERDHYDLDRVSTSEYFKLHPKWEKGIKTFFGKLHEKGEGVAHVDICGRTDARSLGSDVSYCFSLKASDIRKSAADKSTIFIDGDIFNPNDFDLLIKRLKEDGVSPALVTFEPVAGLQSHFPEFKKEVPMYEKVTYGQLEKRFRQIINILKPGGYVYIAKPFQFLGIEDFLRNKLKEEYEMSIRMKELASEEGCTIEISSELGGPYYLVRKPIRKHEAH
ncbi:MAG: hypothetical protein V4664_00710 [Patescibacteria group bacterium]